MKEHDPLRDLLHEWPSSEPGGEFDARVVDAYRRSVRPPLWRRMWTARISVPVPLVLAAMAAAVLLFWLHTESTPRSAQGTTDIVTRLDATGFEPLPNGDARVVPVQEVRQ